MLPEGAKSQSHLYLQAGVPAWCAGRTLHGTPGQGSVGPGIQSMFHLPNRSLALGGVQQGEGAFPKGSRSRQALLGSVLVFSQHLVNACRLSA